MGAQTCIFVPTALTGHYICSEMKTEAFFQYSRAKCMHVYSQILSSLTDGGRAFVSEYVKDCLKMNKKFNRGYP